MAPLSAALLALAFGLATACCFGTGDFLAQRLTRRHGWFAAVFAVQIAAALVLGAAALVARDARSSWAALGEAWVPILVLGVVNTLGLVGLYLAFERGKLSLVSPIAGSMGAFAIAFTWVAGAAPATVLAPGLFAVVIGIIVASVVVDPGDLLEGSAGIHGARGVGWALVSAAAFGWVFVRIGQSGEAVGPAWTVWWLRLVAIAGLGVLALVTRWPLREPSAALVRGDRWRLLAVAILDSGGMLTFAYASSRADLGEVLAILVVLASCFPIVTVALAQLRLRESLRWWQWCGVVAVSLGIAWISFWAQAD